MQLTKTYKDIHETMKFLYIQIKDSLEYADAWLPSGIKTPSELYSILKANTVFINDGKDEILQEMPTLMDQNLNVWGVAGGGDCDCFTISVSACCLILNFKTKIVLAGRSQHTPVHIYNLVYDQGVWCPFDLTNRFYKEVRKYPYTQNLPVLR